MKPYDTLFNSNMYKDSKKYAVIKGNSIDINIQEDDCEVRADIIVSKVYTVRVWGQVLDYNGIPVSSALVKLIRFVNLNGIMDYEGIAHTLTDCNGFYQVDVPACDTDNKYKILVSKSSIGNERKVIGSNYNPYEGNKPLYKPNVPPPPYPPIQSKLSKPIYQNNDKPVPNKPAKSIYQSNEQQHRTGYKPSEQSQKPIYQNNEAKQKPIYNENEQLSQNPIYQTNENIDRVVKYDSAPMHNSFYVDQSNKSNILNKNE